MMRPKSLALIKVKARLFHEEAVCGRPDTYNAEIRIEPLMHRT